MSINLRAVRTALVAMGVSALTACGSSAPAGSQYTEDGGGHIRDSGKQDVSLSTGDARSLAPGSDAPASAGTLTISPSNPTLAVTNPSSPPTETFTAKLDMGGSTHSVSPNWSLSDFSIGTITAGGKFTPAGTVAGSVKVIAAYGGLTATTKLTVTVSYSTSLGNVTLPDGTVISNDSGAITAADLTALLGTPSSGDSGTPTTLIYPYDKTVFPLGLLAPVAQFSAGAIVPVDFKVSLDATGFHWDGFGHVGNPAALQAAIPQSAWDGALASAVEASATNASVTLSLVKAAAGVAYGPAQSHLTIANGKLTGVIYYESYSTDPIDGGADAAGATDFGLWAVKPGLTQPPSHLQPGCVICHGVSASGNTLTNGTDDPTIGASTGVFRVEADGGYTHLATAPANLPYPITSTDSRGLGWGTVSPDGKVILRGQTYFWGGDLLLAWATPNAPLMEAGVLQPLSTTMTVNGDFNMFVPEFSVDGKHLVYVTAVNTGDAGAPGTESQSIGMVDISTSLGDGGGPAGFGSVTLSNARTLYDSTEADGGGAAAYTKVPTVLPDSASIVFEETHQSYTGYNHMLPDYLGQAVTTDPGVDGELATLQPTGSGSYVRAPMTNANNGYDPNSPTVNYEPKPLPVEVGGYYWVVFTSRRTDAYPNLAAPKKLWVTAISPGGTPGVDPSHPPFTLINQAIIAPQASQRAYWSLAPCLGTGAGCQSGSDCCNGSCIPQSSTDPTSPLVCQLPATMACAPIGGRCTAGQNQDCCNASQGVTCIGTLNGYGTCNMAGPPPPP